MRDGTTSQAEVSSIRVVAEFQSPTITQEVTEAAARKLHLLYPDIAEIRDGVFELSCVVIASSNDLAVRYLLKRVRGALGELGVQDTSVMILRVEALG